MIVRSPLALAFASTLFFVAACADQPPDATGSVVFGITSPLRPGVDIEGIELVQRVDGAIVDQSVWLFKGDPPLVLPGESWVKDRAPGERVDLELRAFGSPGGFTVLERRASTEAVAGRSLLYRVHLDAKCTVPAGPNCGADHTCAGGACKDPFLAPSALEDHDPRWADQGADGCKPIGGGDPIVVVGRGQADYLPAEDYAVAQVEAGPQGGHHVWVAVRMKNLRRSGSITTVRGYVPELGYEVPAFNVVFTFDPDEGGYCKLFGLRYQLDSGGKPIAEILGKVVELEVEVTDADGAVGVGKRTLTLSEGIL